LDYGRRANWIVELRIQTHEPIMEYSRMLKQFFLLVLPGIIGSILFFLCLSDVINGSVDTNTYIAFTLCLACGIIPLFGQRWINKSRIRPSDPKQWLDAAKANLRSATEGGLGICLFFGITILALVIGALWQIYQEGVGQQDAIYVWIWLPVAIALFWLSWRSYKVLASGKFPQLQFLDDPVGIRWIYIEIAAYGRMTARQTICVCTDKGRMYGIPYTQNSRDAIMNGLVALAPHAVVGYSAERLLQFKKDPSGVV